MHFLTSPFSVFFIAKTYCSKSLPVGWIILISNCIMSKVLYEQKQVISLPPKAVQEGPGTRLAAPAGLFFTTIPYPVFVQFGA